MTKIVGLTGGMGSGKTTIANMFKDLGVSIYIADDEARIITNQVETLNEIKLHFGNKMVVNNQLDRTLLAQLVFQDASQLQRLNSIIHPKVAAHFANWLKIHADERFIIKESAILFETNSYLTCDYVITVTASIEERIARVMQREAISEQEIKDRIRNQWTDEQRVELSDFVIENHDLITTRKQVFEVYQSISSRLENP